MATIKDIAKKSGYSIGTVSRVLNNHPDVSDETREKILKIVEDLHFVPNANAKNLKQHNAGIAVFVKGRGNVLFADILERIQYYLSSDSEDTSIFYIDEDENEVEYARKIMQSEKPIGMIFLGGNLKYFEQEFQYITVPSVLLTNNASQLGFDNLSSFSTDDKEACRKMMEYLIEKGHTKIGIVGGNANLSETQISYRRIQGCKQAFEEHGLTFDEKRYYEPSRFSMKDGYEAAYRLYKKANDITAVFALGDVIAVGAVRAAYDAHLRIPEDISLIGYDGLEITKYTVPRITSVQQNSNQLALVGVTDLLRRIHNKDAVGIHELIPFSVVEGDSVSDHK